MKHTKLFTRNLMVVIGAFYLLLGPTAHAAKSAAPSPSKVMKIYKSSSCGCCGKWVDYLKKNGFRVEIVESTKMHRIKKRYKISPELQSCHTGVIGKYVVEGHVPVEAINKLLAERPKVQGIAVPGMPIGSPGMEVGSSESYTVYAFQKNGKYEVFLQADKGLFSYDYHKPKL